MSRRSRRDSRSSRQDSLDRAAKLLTVSAFVLTWVSGLVVVVVIHVLRVVARAIGNFVRDERGG